MKLKRSNWLLRRSKFIKYIFTARVRSTTEGNVFSLSVTGGYPTLWSQVPSQLLVHVLSRGIPVSGPRSLPSLWSHVLYREYPLVLSLVLSKVLFQATRGTPVSQDIGYPQDRTGGTPQTGEQVMLCCGWYASRGHAGGFSCHIHTIHFTGISLLDKKPSQDKNVLCI